MIRKNSDKKYFCLRKIKTYKSTINKSKKYLDEVILICIVVTTKNFFFQLFSFFSMLYMIWRILFFLQGS